MICFLINIPTIKPLFSSHMSGSRKRSINVSDIIQYNDQYFKLDSINFNNQSYMMINIEDIKKKE